MVASVGAHALFVTIDVGAPGKNSDGGVFHASKLGRWLAMDSLNIPVPASLPGDETGTPFPYYLCAVEAFPLRENIVRPYPRRTLNNTRRVCNYRLSRARKSIECAFGLMIRYGSDNLEYQKPHVTCIDDDRTGRAKGCHWRVILANYFVHISPIPYQWAHGVGEPAEVTDAE
ncbi:hypothetical protein PR048_021458 [Dryococelus australis]|uniref:DDE Tnp4 domain-containing protein n=1 Tax=Dryococelus australis TaxID=614101 RepID=A0ABQ9GY89_9NEOP|nr:hypothetical protein PR048_021458 [Dryococelus australis]